LFLVGRKAGCLCFREEEKGEVKSARRPEGRVWTGVRRAEETISWIDGAVAWLTLEGIC
jgi:hypothetical protein